MDPGESKLHRHDQSTQILPQFGGLAVCVASALQGPYDFMEITYIF